MQAFCLRGLSVQGGIFTYGLLTALAIALLIAAFTDLRRRQIDNWLNAGIALCAPAFWLASGLSLADIGYQLAVAAAAFTGLAGLFALRAMGGGDVKLLTALALWVSPAWFMRLLIVMSIVGGLLTIIFAVWHVTRRQPGKIAIPYGVAIAFAGLWAVSGQYLPKTTFTSLLG
jgi:prepilin peptidase CpaA